MQFNSPYFLFLFLPVCLLIYYAADPRYRNLVALVASLIFFAWGQAFYLPLMAFIIALNFSLGQALERARETERARGTERAWETGRARWVLGLGIVLNLGLLLFFKTALSYGTVWLGFLPEGLLRGITQNPLPLGLSYITFQVIAYLLDIYNEMHDSEKNLLNFSLYILLFPKLIVGPITRYRDVAEQLVDRPVAAAAAADGARRFIFGLAKKVLIADQLARVVNPAFGLDSPNFSTGMAWLVLVGFALQLYFDFSGYTDMAIGLGKMLGFSFVENFNYPYISRSISDFWRRWHISLSTWFRDYVFYPLEFARRRRGGFRQQANILLVFLLTGLWHGVTVNFAIWGLVHGLAIALEMTGLGRWLKKAWAPLQHAYALLVILIGWAFFRSPTPAYAGQLLARLVGLGGQVTPLPYSVTRPLPIVENSVWLALALALVFSLPVLPALKQWWEKAGERSAILRGAVVVGGDVLLLFLLVGLVAVLVGSSYVASIYGGF